MKLRVQVITCVVVVAFTVFGCVQSTPPPEPEPEAPTNKLIGVWKNAGLVDTDLDIPEEAKGIVADYYMVFTEKFGFVVGSRIPNRQELPEDPTDSQLLAAWEPVTAFARTYEIKGNTVVTRLLFAKTPLAEPAEQESHPFKFDGDDLLWTYKANEGRNTITLRFTRLE